MKNCREAASRGKNKHLFTYRIRSYARRLKRVGGRLGFSVQRSALSTELFTMEQIHKGGLASLSQHLPFQYLRELISVNKAIKFLFQGVAKVSN